MLRCGISLLIALSLFCDGSPMLAQCNSYGSFGFTTSNQTVYFTMAPVMEEGVSILSVEWNLGDGAISTIASPIHTYNQADTYEVCIQVVLDVHGELCTTQSCETVQIQSGLPCWIGANFGWIDLGEAMVLSEAFVSAGSFTEINSLQWSLDGMQVSNEASAEISVTPNTQTPLCLTVSGQANSNNCSVTHCQQVEVAAPQFDFEPGIVLKEEAHCQFAFIDSNNMPPGAELLNRSWSLGDGNAAEEAQVLYSYAENGTYTVCLNLDILWYSEVLSLSTCQEVIANCAAVTPQPAMVSDSEQDERLKLNNLGYGVTLVWEATRQSNDSKPKIGDLMLMDLSGRTLLTSQMTSDAPLTLDGLPAGCYIARIGEAALKFYMP